MTDADSGLGAEAGWGVVMDFSGGNGGVHKLVTITAPGRIPTHVLCLVQMDSAGEKAYYVLAEQEDRPTRWRLLIKDNMVRKLKDEFVATILNEWEVDGLDVETIFFCATETSKLDA